MHEKKKSLLPKQILVIYYEVTFSNLSRNVLFSFFRFKLIPVCAYNPAIVTIDTQILIYLFR